MPRLREEKRLREQRLTGIKTGIPVYAPAVLELKGFKLRFYDLSDVKIGELGADVKEGRVSEIEFELMDFGCGAFSFVVDSLPAFTIGFRTRVDIHPYFDSSAWFTGFVQKIPLEGQRPPFRYVGFGYFEQLNWVTVSDSYQNAEVSVIVKDIIQNIVAPSTEIVYNADKIQATSYTVGDISFDHAFAKDALQALANIAQGWEFGVDNSREFYFRPIDTTVYFNYWSGRQFQDVEVEEDPLSIRNKLYVKSGKIQSDGSNIIGTVSDSTSISTYGLREEVVTAPDILDNDDALEWAEQVLEDKKNPKTKARIKNVFLDTTKAKIEAKGKIKITTEGATLYTFVIKRVLYRISAAGILGEIDCGTNPHPFEECFVEQVKRVDDEQRLADKRTKELATDLAAETEKVRPLILDTATAQLTIENKSTEETLYSYAFAAGELGANDAVRVIICCRFLNQTGGARGYTLRIKLGSTTIYADATKSFASGAAYRAWFVRFILNNLNSQSSQALNGAVEISNVQAATTGLGDIAGAGVLDGESPIHGVASEDMSAAKTLSVTVQFPAALANLKIDRYFAMIEKLPTV